MRKEDAPRPLALVGSRYEQISTMLREIWARTNSLLIQLPLVLPGYGYVSHEPEIVFAKAGHSPNSAPLQPAS
jgi:hypothetical protein